MIPINNLLKFYTAPPAGEAKGNGAALRQAATMVDEGARKRYGYRFPVYISDKAFKRCVAKQLQVASKEEGQRMETLRLFNVLAKVKYAIRHADPGSTMANVSVRLNDRKDVPDEARLTVMVILPGQAEPALLIKLADERHEEDLESLTGDWATGVSTIKEAV